MHEIIMVKVTVFLFLAGISYAVGAACNGSSRDPCIGKNCGTARVCVAKYADASNCSAKATCETDPCSIRRCDGPCKIVRPGGSSFSEPMAECVPTPTTISCDNVRCDNGTVCVSASGSCGSCAGKRTVECRDPCNGVMCCGCEKCSLVYLDTDSPCCTNVIGVCGGDPCVTNNKCGSNQGCYTTSSCVKGKCRLTSQCRNPCDDHPCPDETQRCVPETVTCIRAPCNPVPTCVSTGVPTNPCAATQCLTNTTCVVEDGQAVCRPNTVDLS